MWKKGRDEEKGNERMKGGIRKRIEAKGIEWRKEKMREINEKGE